MPRGTGKKANPEDRSGKLNKYMPSGGGRSEYHSEGETCDWSAVHPDLLAAAVVAIDRAGGAVLFGADRNRTQMSVTLFFAGEKNTFYWYRNSEHVAALEQWLTELVSDLNS